MPRLRAAGGRGGGVRIVVAVVFLATLGIAGDSSDEPLSVTSAPPPAGAWAGIAAGSTILFEDGETQRRHLDGIASTKARWLRVDLYWGVIEAEAGEYDWAATDAVITGARQRGMSVIAVAGYTPSWARAAGTTDKHPPDDPADFGRFLRAAAARYRPAGVRVWEIWNEPNVADFWQPRPDPAAYTELLLAASSAVREVDPGATVLLGGLAPSDDESEAGVSPATFLRGVYAAGGGPGFDGVAVHPYSWPSHPLDPTTADWNAFQAVPRLREVMVDEGDGGKRIWGTEFGAPTGTHDRAVSPDEQLRMIADAYAAWLSWPWTGPLLVYQYRDAGDDGSEPEQRFGLVDRDFNPKVDGAGFRAVVEATICDGPARPGCRP